MTVREALTFFSSSPKVLRRLQVLDEIGLGYLRLGQPATTLSGGEAQRIKIAAHLSSHTRRAAALHPRRADDRPALRRHREAAGRVPQAARGRAHAARHRAQPRRDQDRRLDHRSRARRRRGGRRRSWRPARRSRSRRSRRRTPAATCGTSLAVGRANAYGSGTELNVAASDSSTPDATVTTRMARALTARLLVLTLALPGRACPVLAQQQAAFDDVVRNLRNPDPKARLSARAAAARVAVPRSRRAGRRRSSTIRSSRSSSRRSPPSCRSSSSRTCRRRKRVALVVEVRSKGQARPAFELGPLAVWPRPVPPELVDGAAQGGGRRECAGPDRGDLRARRRRAAAAGRRRRRRG